MAAAQKVVVAMSGGVDSSVTAAMLVEQGYDVIGMMLRLWSEPGSEAANRCCTPDAMAMARRIAASLDIPFYAVDARQVFHDTVVTYFIDGYTQGSTPNPCLVCNRHIRWEFLLQHALTLGADFMATGHYARVQADDNGRFQLLRAVDRKKDQSYVLHVLDQEQLSHALFPLGDYTKTEVRQMAQRYGLPVAERPDSQDLCFLGNNDYREFLAHIAPQVQSPGPILDRQGKLLGDHQGLAFYTIGQRKGLGIAAPQPLYVLEKDVQRNTLIVGRKEELGSKYLSADQINWISSPPAAPFRAEIKIRYQAEEAWGTVTPTGKQQVQVEFDQPLRDITKGQAAVFFDGERCLGGGIIS